MRNPYVPLSKKFVGSSRDFQNEKPRFIKFRNWVDVSVSKHGKGNRHIHVKGEKTKEKIESVLADNVLRTCIQENGPTQKIQQNTSRAKLIVSLIRLSVIYFSGRRKTVEKSNYCTTRTEKGSTLQTNANDAYKRLFLLTLMTVNWLFFSILFYSFHLGWFYKAIFLSYYMFLSDI